MQIKSYGSRQGKTTVNKREQGKTRPNFACWHLAPYGVTGVILIVSSEPKNMTWVNSVDQV